MLTAPLTVTSATPIPRHPLIGIRGFLRRVSPVPALWDRGPYLLTHSGRSAIGLALAAGGIGERARVLVPNYYCPTMIAPIERAGAAPVFYPITQGREPNLPWLTQWCEGHPDRGPMAMLAVHFFGLPVPLAAVRALCDRYDILLIEDCAHAFYGLAQGMPVGTSGDFAIASLPKFFPVLEGGLLTGKGLEGLASPLERRSWLTEVKALWNMAEAVIQCHSGVRAASRGAVRAEPRPSEMTVRAEALSDPLLEPRALRRIERLLVKHFDHERSVCNRVANYRYFAERFSGCAGCRVLFPQLNSGAVPYVFPLYVTAAETVYPRLRDARLPVFRWDRYWPGSLADGNDLGRDWGHHVLQISCHQDLSRAHIEAMAQLILRAVAAG
jgi:perosamine synthetase